MAVLGSSPSTYLEFALLANYKLAYLLMIYYSGDYLLVSAKDDFIAGDNGQVNYLLYHLESCFRRWIRYDTILGI